MRFGLRQELVYRELWPGIDMAVHGADGRLKYEFVVHPGAAVDDIRLDYRGSDRLTLDSAGNLVVRTPLGDLTDSHPTSFQLIRGRRIPVASRYRVGKDTSYGFAAGAYDRRETLVVDPGLVYSTYLGGAATDEGRAIGLDGAGSVHVVGSTTSTDFPTTAEAFDTSHNGFSDVFVVKLPAMANPPTLTLSPAAGTNPVATSHTVTALVTDSSSPPVPDVTVRFGVSGSVTASGSCTTGADGRCAFTYPGPHFPGSDTISAYADTNGNGVPDGDEPASAATKAWVLPASTAGRTTGWGQIPGPSGPRVRFHFAAGNHAVLSGGARSSTGREARRSGAWT